MEILINDTVDNYIKKHYEDLAKIALSIIRLEQDVIDNLVFNTDKAEFESLPDSYDDQKKIVESSVMRHLVYVMRDFQRQIYEEQ